MCEIKKTEKQNSDGTIDLTISCLKTGKHITSSNKYGMYCEDKCNKENDNILGKNLKDWIDNFCQNGLNEEDNNILEKNFKDWVDNSSKIVKL